MSETIVAPDSVAHTAVVSLLAAARTSSEAQVAAFMELVNQLYQAGYEDAKRIHGKAAHGDAYLDVIVQSAEVTASDSELNLKLDLRTTLSVRNHMTPGSTGAIADRIMAKLVGGNSDHILRIAAIPAASVVSEHERMDRATGEVREILPDEGTW